MKKRTQFTSNPLSTCLLIHLYNKKIIWSLYTYYAKSNNLVPSCGMHNKIIRMLGTLHFGVNLSNFTKRVIYIQQTVSFHSIRFDAF